MPASSLEAAGSGARQPARRAALREGLAWSLATWLRGPSARVAAGASLLAGCGFQLRGAYEMPFRRLYTGFPPASTMGAEFKRALRAAGDVVVVDKPAEADARLDVLAELREKEILAFSSTGRPREYQIRLRFRFRLLDAKGEEWIEPTELLLRRDISTTDAQLTAKAQEEVLLYREMQTDAVQQLMRRLVAAPRRQGAAPAGA
jgi:LPS-assembly lipoprotein